MLALEISHEVMPFVIAGIALLLLLTGLAVVLLIGAGRPHS